MTTTTQEHQMATRQIDLLDHGYIRLIKWMGDDLDVIRAARVSFNAQWRTGSDEGSDKRLLRRLWSGGAATLGPTPAHSTPFEAVACTFEVKAPIFVFRQWHRHRTQSYNELSLRYKELPSEHFYIPAVETIGVPDPRNKQARIFTELSDAEHTAINVQRGLVADHHAAALRLYQQLLQLGWPRELARGVLPFNTYSEMHTTGNLLNFIKFLNLRADSHAQYEIRVYAEAMATLLTEVVPETMALWREARGMA